MRFDGAHNLRYYSLIMLWRLFTIRSFLFVRRVPLRTLHPPSVIRSPYSVCTRANASARLRCVSTLYRHGITCMLRRAQQYSHIGSDISFRALSSYRGINVKRTRRSIRLDSTQGSRLASSLSSCSLTGFRPFSFSRYIPYPRTRMRIAEAGYT